MSSAELRESGNRSSHSRKFMEVFQLKRCMLYAMRWFDLAVVSVAALGLAVIVEEASAGGRSGGHSSSGSSRGAHHGSHFHGRVFVGVGAPLFWGPYPYYYGPAYYYPPPPAYIEQGPAPAEQGSQYWYYCPSARAYYPYVDACPEGWQRVLPQPYPPPPAG